MIRPKIVEVVYILNDTLKNCRNTSFDSFVYRCVYDIKFRKIENNEEVFSSITLGFMKYKSQFYGLIKKIRNARKACFRFSGRVKSTIKFDSSLSNINVC